MLLATPLHVLVLRALEGGPKPQAELRHAAGSPALTTLRAHLQSLSAIDAIAKHRRNRFPGQLSFELTDAGNDLLSVAGALEGWLESAPGGPLDLGTSPAKAAVKALAEGWSSTIVRALASGPLSLTELDRVISSLNYPSLERRLNAMRLAGQIEPSPSNGRSTPYVVTDWLRRGVGPLAAATRWEHRHLAQSSSPVTRIDAEATFLLTVPLLRLPAKVSGSCRLAVEVTNGTKARMAGVMVHVNRGRVESCVTRLQGSPDAWAIGPLSAWLAALIEAAADQIEIGGDSYLARHVMDGLHGALSSQFTGRQIPHLDVGD